ncbi:hypothetical protein BDQ17DRAFT_1330099 [Cyathus striatus]|nr:hypothetical protein BDQ17DRAFT_1330099 [Cyathus striatus]
MEKKRVEMIRNVGTKTRGISKMRVKPEWKKDVSLGAVTPVTDRQYEHLARTRLRASSWQQSPSAGRPRVAQLPPTLYHCSPQRTNPKQTRSKPRIHNTGTKTPPTAFKPHGGVRAGRKQSGPRTRTFHPMGNLVLRNTGDPGLGIKAMAADWVGTGADGGIDDIAVTSPLVMEGNSAGNG